MFIMHVMNDKDSTWLYGADVSSLTQRIVSLWTWERPQYQSLLCNQKIGSFFQICNNAFYSIITTIADKSFFYTFQNKISHFRENGRYDMCTHQWCANMDSKLFELDSDSDLENMNPDSDLRKKEVDLSPDLNPWLVMYSNRTGFKSEFWFRFKTKGVDSDSDSRQKGWIHAHLDCQHYWLSTLSRRFD